jgi:AcrR family transcriptional regulator
MNAYKHRLRYRPSMTGQPPEQPLGLRERKRARTRAAIVAAGADLFQRFGYDETTIADIAAAADIGTRTFFGYFRSKEELLFPQSDARVAAALAAIDSRAPGERPAQVLLRGLLEASADDDDLVSSLAALRLHLIQTVPAVQGRAMQTQLEAQRQIAARLRQAYPDELDPVAAAALVGAFTGAVAAALLALFEQAGEAPAPPDELRDQLHRATAAALDEPVRSGGRGVEHAGP